MDIRKILKMALMIIFIAITLPMHSNGMTATIPVNPGDSMTDAQVAARIIQRVGEIQNMDKTDLSPAEKRDLRKELTGLKNKADDLNKKIYISIGAVIIIILLLILILR